MNLDPKHYGLPPRTKLQKVSESNIAIVKLIKSRIIQKDAKKLLEMKKQIQAIDSTLEVSLICYDNICSKSLVLFDEAGVKVLIES